MLKCIVGPSGMILLAFATGVAGAKNPERLTAAEPGDQTVSIKVGDLERRYVVHVPPGYDRKTPAAMVLMFHGAGGTARGAMRQTGWTAKADQAGFLAVFPEAVSRDPSQPSRFKNNPQIWNDGSGRGHAARRNIDDVAFGNALMDDLEARFTVDKSRIYVTGFANGGSMAFRLGAELSNRVAAIACVSGRLWLNNAKPERAVSLVFLIGSQDPFNPLDETSKKATRGANEKPSARASVFKWAELLGCALQPKMTYDQDGVQTIAYQACREESEVVFYTIEGMGHTWPGGNSRLPEWMVGKTSNKLRATDVIWEFFKKHPIK